MSSFRVNHLEWIPGWVLVLGLVLAAFIGMYGRPNWRDWHWPAWMRRATKKFTILKHDDRVPSGEIRVKVKRWYTFLQGVRITNYRLVFDRRPTFLASGSSNLGVALGQRGSHEYELVIPHGCDLLLVEIANIPWLLRFTSYTDVLGRHEALTMTEGNYRSLIPNIGLCVRRDVDSVTRKATISFVTPNGHSVWQGTEGNAHCQVPRFLDTDRT